MGLLPLDTRPHFTEEMDSDPLLVKNLEKKVEALTKELKHKEEDL